MVQGRTLAQVCLQFNQLYNAFLQQKGLVPNGSEQAISCTYSHFILSLLSREGISGVQRQQACA